MSTLPAHIDIPRRLAGAAATIARHLIGGNIS